MISREAYAFFRANAGGWIGHNAESALHLARAEAYAASHGWSVSWEWDDGPDLGDHEEWCNGPKRARHEGWREGAGCDHEVMCAVLRDSGRNVLGSLGGIIDADSRYRRVVAAELMSEALAKVRARQDKQRKARAFVRTHFAL